MSETIVAAAHAYDTYFTHKIGDPRRVPVIVSAPPPARHHNLFVSFGGANFTKPTQDGFLTSTGRFVDREEGLKIAIASGQPMIDHPSRNDRYLFSEDLW